MYDYKNQLKTGASKEINIYEYLSVFDLLTLRILKNYQLICFSSLGFLLLSLVPNPLLQATGVVFYFVCMIQIFYINLRFGKAWVAALSLLSLTFNLSLLYYIFLT